ncbi:MAG: hypothetical protein QXN55_00575 [Candidatus Nitrosotenuis sp.]
MKKLLLILPFLLILVSCAHTVVDRDFEKEEAEYIKKYGVAAKDPFYAPPTPDHIMAGEKDDVRITIHKGTPTMHDSNDSEHSKIELQNWFAVLTNDSEKPVCVMTEWKLMDFELISDYPGFVYMSPNSQIVTYAHLKQQVWNIDGTKFALPPSGYVEDMIIRDPVKKAKVGDECVFDDDDVEEQ